MTVNIEALKWFMSRYLRLIVAVDHLLDETVSGRFSMGDERDKVEKILVECDELVGRGVTIVEMVEKTE